MPGPLTTDDAYENAGFVGTASNTSPVSTSDEAPWMEFLSECGQGGPIVVTIGESLPRHEEWEELARLYAFLELSFTGGPNYKDGVDSLGESILYRHESRESEDAYEDRKSAAVLKNYCKPIVRKFNSYVFRQDVKRDGGDPQFLEWCKDVDTQGTPLVTFMQKATRKAQTMGSYLIGIDTNRPADMGEITRVQADAMGLQMILLPIDPRRMINWRRKNGQLTEALIVFDSGLEAVLWTETTMQRITLDPDSKLVIAVEPVIAHGYPGIPLIEMRPFEEGESQIGDIAELQKDIFNLDSLLRQELYNATFTQVFAIGVKSDELKDQTFGSEYVICIPNKDAKIDKSSADPAQADSIRTSINEGVTEIFRQAGLKAEDPMAVSPAKSGIALKVEFDDLDAVLSSIADEAERCENVIIDLYNQANNSTVKHSDYPEHFGTPDLALELERMFSVTGSSSFGPTAKTLEGKRATQLLYPKATPQERQQMDEETVQIFAGGGDQAHTDMGNMLSDIADPASTGPDGSMNSDMNGGTDPNAGNGGPGGSPAGNTTNTDPARMPGSQA